MEKYLNGLTKEQVEESRLKHGDNRITPAKKEPLWKAFLEKFSDPIIKILLTALALAVAVSLYQIFFDGASMSVLFEPLGIFVAILLATVVGFVFEVNANKKFEVLNQAQDEEMVVVKRDGYIQRIERKDVVVGDVVVLSTGDEVPADGTLVEAISLRVNESDLTGEPSISKTTKESEFKTDVTYPSNYVCRGSTIMEGHGIFIVEKVGDDTEWGKVYKGAQIENNIKTPLNEQLDKLGHFISIISYVMAVMLIALRLALYFVTLADAFSWLDFARYMLNTLMIAVTLVVVAVPEGLPMSVTLSLALSMHRMLETKNLVRKMHACETMGAATVICTDKTGTLTQNRMSVNEFKIYGLHDNKLDNSQTSALIKEGISVNTTAFLDFTGKKVRSVGNPTEAALLYWLFSQNVDFISYRDKVKILRQIPFSTEYKFMATIVATEDPDMCLLYVKGAPEVILAHCSKIRFQESETDITPDLKVVKELLDGYQNRAMRTLGFAYKYVLTTEVDSIFEDNKIAVDDLCYLATVAIADPVRDDVPDAVNDCLKAGIDVKIVTGDTPGTAKEIGRQIGLWKDGYTDGLNHISGPDFAALDDKEASLIVNDLKIMSRAKPMDKERLVKLLQKKNHVVAVTGDGTNDAPALNTAHIGLSMGDGTSVAKEASDITILDNSFKTITRAVGWGRSLYNNIQRFILFQMTINVAACLIVLIGAVLGTRSPLTVTQMLWVNLIMDTLAALALASLPPDPKVMLEKPRRRNSFIISSPMSMRIFFIGLFFVALMLGMVQYLKHENVTSLTDFSLSSYFSHALRSGYVADGITPYESTLFFTTFVFMQFWNLFNAKAFKTNNSAFKDIFTKPVMSGFGTSAMVIALGQVLIVNFGGQMFNVEPISLNDWIYIVVGTSVILWIGEVERLIKRIIKRLKALKSQK